MKRVLFVTSLVCTALVGCGDDKSPIDTNPSTPSNPSTPDDDDDGDEETAGNSSATVADTGENPTTGVVGTEGMTSNGPTNTTPPDGTEGGSTTMPFLVPLDGQTGGTMCNPFTQDCPDGQKCQPYADDGGTSWNNDKCVDITGDKIEGDPCFAEGGGVAGLDDCAEGFFCWDTDAENNGTCVQLCTGSAEAGECENNDKTCAVYNDGTLPLCLDQCDPISQDCDPSDVCIGNPTGEGFLCVLDASGEEGQQHDPCEFANSCDPGLLCNAPTAANECDPNAMGCCEPFCDLTDPNADMNCGGAGQVCNPYFEEGMAPPDAEDVGYCAIPM